MLFGKKSITLFIFLFLGLSLLCPFILLYKIKKTQIVDEYLPYSKNAYLQYERVFQINFPRNKNGDFNFKQINARNNQIDAFRHSFVSGVIAMKYGVIIAKLLGNIKENWDDFFFNQSPLEKNMDYWNNNIGRFYGKNSQSEDELSFNLKKAILRGELIININDDKRIYR